LTIIIIDLRIFLEDYVLQVGRWDLRDDTNWFILANSWSLNLLTETGSPLLAFTILEFPLFPTILRARYYYMFEQVQSILHTGSAYTKSKLSIQELYSTFEEWQKKQNDETRVGLVALE